MSDERQVHPADAQRDVVVEAIHVAGKAHAETLVQQGERWTHTGVDELAQRHRIRHGSVDRPSSGGGGDVGLAASPASLGGGQHRVVEARSCGGHVEVALVVGPQRVPGENGRGAPAVAADPQCRFERGVDDVEQFAELDGKASVPVGRDVGAVARHDQRLLRRQQGVEQQMPAFGRAVPLADARPDGKEVVAVDCRASQAVLVEAEEAHHLGGDVANRGAAGERHGARAETQPPTASGDDSVDDGEHVVERKQ